jgi:hypothetical protein
MGKATVVVSEYERVEYRKAARKTHLIEKGKGVDCIADGGAGAVWP